MCAPEWSLSLALGVILYISPNNIRYISLFFFCSFRENKMSAVVIAYGVLWSNDRYLQSSKYESPLSLSLSSLLVYSFAPPHPRFGKRIISFILLFYFFSPKSSVVASSLPPPRLFYRLKFLRRRSSERVGFVISTAKGGIYTKTPTVIRQWRKHGAPGLRILSQPGIDLVARFLHCLFFFFWAKFSFFPKRFPFFYLTPFKVEQSSPVLTPHQQQPRFTRISFACQQRQIFCFVF
jgi:hypothetical protein